MELVSDSDVLLLSDLTQIPLLFEHLFPSRKIDGLLVHHVLKVLLVHHAALCFYCTVGALGESALAEIPCISVRTSRQGNLLLAGCLVFCVIINVETVIAIFTLGVYLLLSTTKRGY